MLLVQDVNFADLKFGDIVVYGGWQAGLFFSHRLISKGPHSVLVKGDAALFRLERIESCNIWGRVKCIIRDGNQIDLQSSRQKKINIVLAGISLWAPAFLFITRKVMLLLHWSLKGKQQRVLS